MPINNANELPMWVNNAVKETLEKLRNGPEPGVIGSGFFDIDQMTGGLWPGDLIIVAGSPEMGKTALALNIAEHLAFKESKTAVFISVDLRSEQLALRTVCSIGRISLQNLHAGKLTADEHRRLKDAFGTLALGRLHIEWYEEFSISAIRDLASRYSKKCGNLGLVVVDYLQRLSSNEHGPITVFEIAETLRQLKALANEFQCPVIALSQLPPKVEMRRNKRPVLTDLGPIEPIRKYVDTVILLYRDEVYTKDSCPEPGLVDAVFPLRRDGSYGETRLVFLNQIAKFESLACQA